NPVARISDRHCPWLERNPALGWIDDDAVLRGRRAHQLRVVLREAELERVVRLPSPDVPLPGDRELLRSGRNGEHRCRGGSTQRHETNVANPHRGVSVAGARLPAASSGNAMQSYSRSWKFCSTWRYRIICIVQGRENTFGSSMVASY